MEWSGAERGKPRLGVRWMALALIVAAFLGGGLGLLWQTFGADDEAAADSAASAEAQ